MAQSPGTGGPARRLRTALVGAGLVGQAAHATTLWEERERFEFAAVVDLSATVRSAVAERYGVPATFATLGEALATGLDAVVVAVPDAAHRDTVLAALAAGTHVLCEKPLALTVAECDDIVAARGQLVVQVGYMKLHDPAVQRAVTLLQSWGEPVVSLTVEVNDPDQGPFVDHLPMVAGADVPPDAIADTRTRTRAAVADAVGADAAADPVVQRGFEAYLSALVHDVSLARHLLAATGVTDRPPLVDAAVFDAGRGVALAWALPGGGRAHLQHLNLPGVPDYTERVTVACPTHLLELTFPSPYLRHQPTRLTVREAGDGPAALRATGLRASYEEAFRTEARAFHASITQGAPVLAGARPEAGREDVAVLLDALRLAAENHRKGH